MDKEHRNYHSKYFLTLVFASVLLMVFSTSTNKVFAMGPQSCNNEYDGPFVSFLINNGTQTFDALANPGVTFNVNGHSSYSVTFVIHTPSTSSQNNTLPGSAWYHVDAGVSESVCTGTIGPNQNVTISMNNITMYSQLRSNLQTVDFETRAPSQVYYNVNWLTAPSSPQNLQATAVSSSQINLSWTVPSNNGGYAITGYEIYRSTNGGSTWSTIVSNTGNTTTSYSDTGLAHSTTYTYEVSAINQIGSGRPSFTASSTTFNTVPSSPTGLTATAQILQINLSWNAPSDNGGTPITGYMIERSTDGGNTWNTIVSNTDSTGTIYSDTNVLPLTTYTYRVSAINDIGTGNQSNTASASIASTPTLP